VVRENLTEFGQYVAECLPKFVQQVQLTAGQYHLWVSKLEKFRLMSLHGKVGKRDEKKVEKRKKGRKDHDQMEVNELKMRKVKDA
jgi:hypothetical protein